MQAKGSNEQWKSKKKVRDVLAVVRLIACILLSLIFGKAGALYVVRNTSLLSQMKVV